MKIISSLPQLVSGTFCFCTQKVKIKKIPEC